MNGTTTAAPLVLHAVPGRLRIHLPGWSGGGRPQLEQRLRQVRGVRRVEANPVTGNILIGFDPRTTSQQSLLAALDGGAEATEPAPPTVAPPPDEEPAPPPVLDEAKAGSVRQARIAVCGLDRDPGVARRVVDRLQSMFGVRASASLLTGRVLVEYDERRVHLNELLSKVTELELPDLPGEDRPAHPLDRAPLIQSSARAIGAALGLGLIALRRFTGLLDNGRSTRTAATAAGILGLLRSFPVVRNGLRKTLGRDAADLFFSAGAVIALTFARSPLGLALTGAEGLLLLSEVLARRAAWRRYEERLQGAAKAMPGSVIRLEAGEISPLGAEIIEGAGTAIGRDGLPRQIAPGAEVSAGARLFGGPFVLQLQGGKPFLPQPRPAAPAPTVYTRYLQFLGPASLGYAALTAILTRSLVRTFEALLLVNPRTAVIGMEAANLDAAARVLRGGLIVVGTRPDRHIRQPDVVMLDGPRVLTDGLEVASVLSLGEGRSSPEILSLAAGISAAAGSPWGNAFPRADMASASEGTFNGLWAAADVDGVGYQLGPPEDLPEMPEAVQLLHEGGYLLALSLVGMTLGYIALRPRLALGAAELLQTCQRLGVRLELLSAGGSRSAQGVARRGGVPLIVTDDVVAAIRERQQQGLFVTFVSDSANAAPAFADCDLAVGLSPGRTSRFPARADVLAPDLGAVAALVDAAARRQLAVRDAVGLSVAANVFGAIWGFRGRPGVERASHAVYVTALAALAGGWLRLNGGERRGSALRFHADPRPERWGRQTVANVLRAVRGSEGGLSSKEAARRQRAVPRAEQRREVLAAILEQIRSPVNGILAGGALLSFVAGGAMLDIVIIGATVAINVAAGAWQERQAGRAVEALRRLGTASARVLRDGEPMTVPATAVVPGDVLLLAPGDRVAADGRLLEAGGLEVDEASLTGESVPVAKFAEEGPAEGRIVLEGSDVVVGTGRAVVVAVGPHTRMGATAAALDLGSEEQSPFAARLARLLEMSLPLAAAGGVAVVASGLLWGKPLVAQVSVGVSIALAVVPESLPLLARTGQVGVARRLSKRRALLRRLSAVEALGRVDVACTDKTGTLTEGRLAVRLVADAEREIGLPGVPGRELRDVLRTAALASPHPEAGDATAHPTDVAIVRAAEEAGLGADLRQPRDAEAPFDPAHAFHAAVVGGRLCVKGAPEVLCARCTRLRRASGDVPLDEAGRNALLDRAQDLGERGLRVLMVAEGGPTEDVEEPEGLTAVGFVGIADPLRPTVPAAVRRCREAGVRVLMITGDHPATARAIAAEAGLLGPGDEVISGDDLAELLDDELARRLERAAVVARATPLDKLRIIEGLRQRGHTVAMTGDGVNDAPALRLADVGVAMGRGGTEVARQAADLVLADDDFATLVEALVEGRGFWRNMRRALGLLLGGNIGELGLIVGATVLGFNSPLNTRQILVVNLITDALPALSVVLQQPEHRNLSGLAREGMSALDAALRRDVYRRGAATALPALTAYFLAERGGRLGESGAVAFGTVVATQLAQTLDAGWTEGGLNRTVMGAVAGSAGVLAAALTVGPLRAVLGLGQLTPLGWSLIGTGAAAAVALSRLVTTAGAVRSVFTRTPLANGLSELRPSGSEERRPAP
jgi:calcium-translocating P-type ATPase